MSLLSVTDITKKYKMGEVEVNALNGVSFEIDQGEFIVVLGPSGSGKSTILNIIGGIDSVTTGEVYYQDMPLHTANEKQLTLYRRENVGFVFQFYNLIPNLTAAENIDLAAQLSKNPISTTELLERVGLSDRKGHYPGKMSGGQQQRVAIARAIAKNPNMLLCDEPTGALDYKTGLQILDVLREFNKSYGKTVIVITHNAAIGDVADRVFFIKDGKLEKIDENSA